MPARADADRLAAWLAVLGSAVAVAVAHEPIPPPSGPQAPPIVVYATVRDQAGALVRGLARDDFQILESGRPLEISRFENTPQPIAAALLLDMNGAAVEVPWLRDAALGFIGAMAPDDRVRLGTFGDEIFISPKLTNDRAYFHWLLEEELWAAGWSPLWQAIDRAIASLEEAPGRRTIVVLSNGYHVAPPRMRGVDAGDVMDHAGRARAGVHVVTFERPDIDVGLRRLAERTGGRLAAIKDLSFAPGVLADIAEELHAQYAIGFVPAAWDGDVHEIAVRVARPDAAVRAPTRYRAAVRQ
jgi:VWFA-related protein